MKSLRWASLALLVALLVLTLHGVWATYQASAHSLVNRWGLGRLVFHVARTLAELAFVGVAVARGPRASLLIRVPAFGVVLFRLGVLAAFAPAYLNSLLRLGISVHSLWTVVSYFAFCLALFFLVVDWLERRRLGAEPVEPHVAQS